MTSIRSIKSSARLLAGLAAFAMTGTAGAVVTYTYTGNPFLYIGGCCGVSKVTGSFTLPSALGTNASYDLAGIATNYNFSDGRTTWTPADYPGGATPPFNVANVFSVTTGAGGNIESWKIDLVRQGPAALITTHSLSYAAGGGVLDATNVFSNYDAYTVAPGNPNGQQGIQGVWAVPEPGSYAMLLAGLGLLCSSASLRKRLAAGASGTAIGCGA